MGLSPQALRQMAQAAGVQLIEDQPTDQLDHQLELLASADKSVHDPDCILCNPRLRLSPPAKVQSLNRKLRDVLYPSEKR